MPLLAGPPAAACEAFHNGLRSQRTLPAGRRAPRLGLRLGLGLGLGLGLRLGLGLGFGFGLEGIRAALVDKDKAPRSPSASPSPKSLALDPPSTRVPDPNP